MLDPIQNQALRYCLGAFRTSPIQSIHIEIDEPPLSLRREKLSLNYMLKLKSQPKFPASKCATEGLHRNIFEAKPNLIKPFGLRIHIPLDNLALDLGCVSTESPYPECVWRLSPPRVHFDMLAAKRTGPSDQCLRAIFSDFCYNNKDSIFVYTDGSKTNEYVGSAAVLGDNTVICRVPAFASIFTAEAKAILIAIELVRNYQGHKFIIMTDSLSCLLAIEYINTTHPMICQIISEIHKLAPYKIVELCWVPSHIGIGGNEKADVAAKSAINYAIDNNTKIPYTDLKPHVNKYIRHLIQTRWDTETTNKLHNIKPTIGKTTFKGIRTRKEETTMHRIRIGHTYLSHKHLLLGEEPPQCEHCNVQLTVEHLLIHCTLYNRERLNFFNANNLTQLFQEVNPSVIIQYLKAINLFDKL